MAKLSIEVSGLPIKLKTRNFTLGFALSTTELTICTSENMADGCSYAALRDTACALADAHEVPHNYLRALTSALSAHGTITSVRLRDTQSESEWSIEDMAQPSRIR